MRKKMLKSDLHIELRNRRLARHEACVAERELAVTQLDLTLQETSRVTEKTNSAEDVSSAAEDSPSCEESKLEPTAPCSANMQGKTAVSKSVELYTGNFSTIGILLFCFSAQAMSRVWKAYHLGKT